MNLHRYPITAAVILSSYFLKFVGSFTTTRCFAPQGLIVTDRRWLSRPSRKQYPTGFWFKGTVAAANNENDSPETGDNFDGKGFAGYLAPYIGALFVSIAVTATFVKFVLLDY